MVIIRIIYSIVESLFKLFHDIATLASVLWSQAASRYFERIPTVPVSTCT